MQNLFQDLSKKELSIKRFHENIVKAFFINTINEDRFKKIHMQKNVTFMPQQLLNRPQLYLLMHLITEILVIMTTVTFVTLFKLLSKSVTGLQKSTKQKKKKHFGGCPTS